MNKIEFLRGGDLQPYTAPELDLIEISVEQGFSLSNDWGDGGLEDNENDLGEY